MKNSLKAVENVFSCDWISEYECCTVYRIYDKERGAHTSSEGALVADLVALHRHRRAHYLRVVSDQLGGGQIERHQSAAERELHCGCDLGLVVNQRECQSHFICATSLKQTNKHIQAY